VEKNIVSKEFRLKEVTKKTIISLSAYS